MRRNWTFGQKLGIGFAVMVVLVVIISLVAIYGMSAIAADKERLVAVNARHLILAKSLTAAAERKGGAMRAYLMTRNGRWLEDMNEAGEEFNAMLSELQRDFASTGSAHQFDTFERSAQAYNAALADTVALGRQGASPAKVTDAFETTVVPLRRILDEQVALLTRHEERALAASQEASRKRQSAITTVIALIAAAVGVIATLMAVLLTRNLGRQIGSTVSHVQSSSTELQAAANQQAMGMKEQAVAMSQITSTISELLATSRQIADNAQRVALIAEDTAQSAEAGQASIGTAHDSTIGMQRQVELIVTHMGELGRKSQQIGSIVDIVTELAEQTNILAINATIEAAGAGDAGKRFAVVADEIRKLADRVGWATKDIRRLIDDIRQAVGVTVMTTESGSKMAEASLQRFETFADHFRQIASQVVNTTEAAREIELSTKQQTTAVEQVNIAVANVAQGTRETEASSSQTLRTASELAQLSRDLLGLVRRSA
jgi:methyl-accepting chemotaxis protein